MPEGLSPRPKEWNQVREVPEGVLIMVRNDMRPGEVFLSPDQQVKMTVTGAVSEEGRDWILVQCEGGMRGVQKIPPENFNTFIKPEKN